MKLSGIQDKQTQKQARRSLRFFTLLCLSSLFCILISAAWGKAWGNEPHLAARLQEGDRVASPLDSAKALYDAGRFPEAVLVLRQAAQTYAEQSDRLAQAAALSNLSLCYQQLGQWDLAKQAIETSLTLLPAHAHATRAQALNTQGQLQFAIGQAETALVSWQQAAIAYEQADNITGIVQNQINQAQALQALGFYRRAVDTLTALHLLLQNQPDAIRVVALNTLGDALLVAGSLDQAQAALQQSLALAEKLRQPNAIAAAQLSLGNFTRAEAIAHLTQANLTVAEAMTLLQASPQTPINAASVLVRRRQIEAAQAFVQKTQQAIDLYQQAQATDANTRTQAQLNQLSLLIETQRDSEAQALYPQIQAQLDRLPPNRHSTYSRIDLAQNLIKLGTPALPIARLLAVANQQAQQIGDSHAQSYALGSLGGLYEKTQQWQQARSLTQQALELSQSTGATDISYRWQWQLGRLLKAEGDRNGAVSAYGDAVASLQTLRKDLVAVNRDVQFSFRESVEPVYRELVDLLLKEEISDQTAQTLVRARDVIEGLQIAELDNFFREACLDTAFQLDHVIDQANLSAAIFYTILLPDRLDVILKLPQQPLRYHSIKVAQSEVETTVDTLLAQLKKPFTSQELKSVSASIYDWLIRPQAAALAENQIETLVFVLDGSLRNIPMSALFDGQQYLVENYAVAIAPGLQLPDPKPLENRQLKALVAGLSEARENFPALSFVESEVAGIQLDVPSQVLLNQNFTRNNFQKLLSSADFSIVHIATHGQFSSNAQNTFILAWDDPINVAELGNLLQARDLANPNPIELLVLSACQTAAGDRRAALGLAGVAVRAGARSTIASLWNLDDASGAALMSEFYKELSQSSISRAEALRRAQRSLIANPDYADPHFWSPYVLLGSWL